MLYLGVAESKKVFSDAKRLFRNLKKEVQRNGSVSLDHHLEEDEWLVKLYNTHSSLIINESTIDSNMKWEDETALVILYVLALTSKMPEIHVQLEVECYYNGDFREVYKMLQDAYEKKINNPLVITSFYVALYNSKPQSAVAPTRPQNSAVSAKSQSTAVPAEQQNAVVA